jgi:hypothetical protein
MSVKFVAYSIPTPPGAPLQHVMQDSNQSLVGDLRKRLLTYNLGCPPAYVGTGPVHILLCRSASNLEVSAVSLSTFTLNSIQTCQNELCRIA